MGMSSMGKKEGVPLIEGNDSVELSDRREFLKKAGKTALIAPAVALLVAASLKPKKASAKMYEMPPPDWDL